MSPDVRIERVLVSPDGREKIELFGPREGRYGFRLWRRKREAWRRVSEHSAFETYAKTVVEAGRQIAWLGRAFTPEGDGRVTYHLELLRGYVFQFASFIEGEFGNHDHCSACWATFSERDSPDVRRQGYVTRYQIPNDSKDSQWNWVCEKCFSDLGTEMQWRVANTPG